MQERFRDFVKLNLLHSELPVHVGLVLLGGGKRGYCPGLSAHLGPAQNVLSNSGSMGFSFFSNCSNSGKLSA